MLTLTFLPQEGGRRPKGPVPCSGPCRRHEAIGAVPVSEGYRPKAGKIGDKCVPINVPINKDCKSKTSRVGDKCCQDDQVRLPRRPALHDMRCTGKERLNRDLPITLREISHSDALSPGVTHGSPCPRALIHW